MKAATTILILCAGSLFAQNSLGQDKVRLAVTKISNSGTAFSDDQLKQLTDWLGGELTDKFRIITRENVTMMLEQQAEAQALGCDKESCMADIAKSVNADLSLAGSLSRQGEKFILNIRLVRADASVAAAMDEEIPAMHLQFGIDQAKPLMKFTAQRLWRVYNGEEKIAALPTYKFIAEPDNAGVFLDGRQVCERTPCFWQPKIKGEYRFTMMARGFRDAAVSVLAEPGTESSIEKAVRLEPLPPEEKLGGYKKATVQAESASTGKVLWGTTFFCVGIGGWITAGIYNGKYNTAVDNYNSLGAGDSLSTYNNAWKAVETNHKITQYATIGTIASFSLAFIIWLWPESKGSRYIQSIGSGLSHQRVTYGIAFEDKYEWRYNYAF